MNNYLLTGGSRGLGLEITKSLLESGDRVFAIARTLTTELESLQQQFPDQLKASSVDLADPASIKQTVFENAIGHDLPLHGLINNAAMAYDDIVTNLNQETLETMFRVNVYSAMELTKHVIRNMLLHDTSGSLVHVSSISVHTGYKGLAMYAASKGALEAFSKNTAREWGSRNIRSNCVVAGFMETSMTSDLTDEQKQRIYQRTSLKKATEPGSVAATVQFLLSESSQSITGQNLFVDGGTI